MKEKKFNTAKEIKRLFDNLGDKETLLVLYERCEEENGRVSVGYTDKRSVISAIAAIMTVSLTNKGASKGFDELTDIIIEAVRLVRNSPLVGLELVHRELKDAISDWKGTHKEEDKEEEHPCEGCADILTCMDDDAIDYRKKHHLPKPKKGKKSK